MCEAAGSSKGYAALWESRLRAGVVGRAKGKWWVRRQKMGFDVPDFHPDPQANSTLVVLDVDQIPIPLLYGLVIAVLMSLQLIC